MKVCKDCGKKKKEEEFYGLQGECTECTKKAVRKNYKKNKEYYRSYERQRQRNNNNRMFCHRYSSIKTRVEGRHQRKYKKIEGTKIMSKEEFIKWCNKIKNLNKFLKIRDKWKKSGFKRILCPSIDRIDENKSYTIDNIQWLTLKENMKKYRHKVNLKK